jgi:hypothetical protein
MKTVKIYQYTKNFAENKDIAKQIRTNHIFPTVSNGTDIILDFSGVTDATQSFIHALISEVIRNQGVDSIDRIIFKNCSKAVKTIIQIVIEYVQDGLTQ